MDLLEKKMRWDVKTLASKPILYYGKIALFALGVFLIGRVTK